MPVHRVSFLGFVNAYLVEEADGLTLIDTMLPRNGKRIRDAAAGIGAPIRRIVLTHAHGDHVGSVDELMGSLPDVELLITERDARFLRGEKSLDPGEPEDKLRGGYPKISSTPTGALVVGERVGSLEIFAAPGHTPGQVALLDTRDRTLYCADAYSTLGGVFTTAKTNPRFPLPARATWHRPTALETARALRALDPARLAPGHGKVVESPAREMDAAIAKGA